MKIKAGPIILFFLFYIWAYSIFNAVNAKADEPTITVPYTDKEVCQMFLKSEICDMSRNEQEAYFLNFFKALIDQRLQETRDIEEYSLGDFILSGGETASFVLIDSLVRLIPGVLGDESSALTDSFQDNRLSEPVYTRPENYEGLKVPKILISGNMKEIERWRDKKSLERTKKYRPGML